MINGDDIITFKNGWKLSSLTRTPTGWQAVIEKDVSTKFFPHFVTRFKAGSGPSQSLALQAAMNAKGYSHEHLLHGTREAA